MVDNLANTLGRCALKELILMLGLVEKTRSTKTKLKPNKSLGVYKSHIHNGQDIRISYSRIETLQVTLLPLRMRINTLCFLVGQAMNSIFIYEE